jgi:hypothetical protein
VTIQRAAPFFLLYVVLLGAHAQLASLLHVERGLGHSMIHGGQLLALALLRDVTAFTLLGYLGSELQARSGESTVRIFARVFAVAVPAAVFVGGMRAGIIVIATIGHIGLLLMSSFAGALIHRAQLRLVRSWSNNSHQPPR